MSKLLSFLGGAGKGFLSSVEKAEANAKEEALLRVKRLTENYEKVKEENGKLTNSLKAEESWIKTYYPDATPEQVAYLQGSPDALQALKKMKDPTKISLSEVINIKAANESNAVVMERIEDLPKVAEAVGSKIKAAMPAYRRGIAGIYDEFGEQAGKTAEMRYARAAGVDVQTMEALKPMQRPTQAGTIDIAKLRDQPGSMPDLIKSLEVERYQAKQKFGEGSEQYTKLDNQVKEAQSEIVKADTKLEQRADRLNLQLLDEQDPAKRKVLQADLKSTQQAILDHKKATALPTKGGDGEGGGKSTTIPKLRTSVDMYVHNRMMDDKGFDWKRYVDFKQIPLADGSVYVSPTVKVGLGIEDQRIINEKVRRLQAEALKTNGYIVGGVPRSDAVKEFINNNNIPTDYYSGKATPAPKEQPLPMANAPAANSVTVGGKVYNRPANFTDDQWDQYKKSVGAK